MKKKVIITICLLIVMAVPLTVFAAAPNSKPARAIRGYINGSQLTDGQKSDLVDNSISTLEARKQAVEKMIENGAISQQQGEAVIARIDMQIQYRSEYGFEAHGRLFDPSELTEEQKQDMVNSLINILETRKAGIKKMVENGTITEEKSEKMISRIDKQIECLNENGLKSLRRKANVLQKKIKRGMPSFRDKLGRGRPQFFGRR